jgi:Pilus formation protein N terminal region
MTALFAYRRLLSILIYISIALMLAMAMTVPARAVDTLTVAVDQATITKMPDNVVTLVIGNPLIADVTVQPGGLLVVTGKGFGTTNLIALDRSGAVLAERNIQVLGPQDEVVYVYRGVNRETFSCTPECEPRITLGDSSAFFDATIGQAANRNARAQAGGAAAPAR